jgi:hypothetical protein
VAGGGARDGCSGWWNGHRAVRVHADPANDARAAGLPQRLGAAIAAANYVGYLAGAPAAIVVPRLLHSRWALRLSMLVLTASLALMPLATSVGRLVLRTVAGVTNALTFMIAISAVLHHSLGQIIGPLAVIHSNYHQALLTSAAVVALSAPTVLGVRK